MAADSPNHDRRRDGVDRERVGVRGGRIGRRVNPPARRPVILNSDQTPQYSEVGKAGHEGGDFLFVRRR